MSNSRYSTSTQETVTLKSGEQVAYLAPRMLPDPSGMPRAGEITWQPEERLDLLAARALSDPLGFYELCDANAGLNPFNLRQDAGDVLVVPGPSLGG